MKSVNDQLNQQMRNEIYSVVCFRYNIKMRCFVWDMSAEVDSQTEVLVKNEVRDQAWQWITDETS